MSIFSVENGFGENRVLGYGDNKKFAYNKGQRTRLNARYNVILEPLRKEIEGKTVLDLASHDGRWSFAVLTLGAKHVLGVEYRQELIDFRSPAFDAIDQRRFQFMQGDVFDALPTFAREGRRFDIILNFGLFYHVMDHYRMIKLMRDLNPQMILLDTGLIDSDDAFIKIEMESTESILNVIENKYDKQENIIGLVSRGGLQMMARSLRMNCSYIDWNRENYRNEPVLSDYFTSHARGRKRYSLVLRPEE